MAHRGDQTKYPENSLEAMKSAVELKVDVLETDARLTKDNKLTIFHDEIVDRVSDSQGKVRDFSFEELKKLDIGYNYTADNGETYPFRGKNYRVISLEEFFNNFPDIKLNIDIKDKDEIAVKQLVQIIEEYKAQDRVWVSSFHSEQIQRFRKALPNVLTGAAPQEVREFIINLKLRTLFRIKPQYNGFQVPIEHEETKTKIITPNFVKQAKKKNLAVMVWTINEKSTMEWLINLGVDGIFTDNPDLLIKVLQERKLNF
ncbi:MAG: glycerophosphodiester phosphodiesterase [Candidatus Hodarchaeales archaeon]|jgi:glycerophosphoryl diester phosphodiesterase